MSSLLAYCIQLNSCQSSHFKSVNYFFFFSLFLNGHFPYAGRRRPLQRVRLRSRATSGALTTSNPDSLWYLFHQLWSAMAFRQWGVTDCNSGPAISHCWDPQPVFNLTCDCFPAGGLGKAKGASSIQGSCFSFCLFLRASTGVAAGTLLCVTPAA